MSTKGEQDLSSMPFRALEPTRSPTPHTHYGRHHQRIDRAFNSGTLGNPRIKLRVSLRQAWLEIRIPIQLSTLSGARTTPPQVVSR